MEHLVESVSLQYGDAEIVFFNIKTPLSKSEKGHWHTHLFYELHMAQKGRVEYRFRENTIRLEPGELLIIPPEVEHYSAILCDQSSPTVVSMSLHQVESDQKFYAIFQQALWRNARKPIRFTAQDIDVLECVPLYRSVLGVLKLKQSAAEFVNRLFQRLMHDSSLYAVSDNAKQVLLDVLVNMESVTLDEIAAATHYSKRHVSRLIRKFYGIPLSQLKKKIQEEKV